jgi:hypothetical protein
MSNHAPTETRFGALKARHGTMPIGILRSHYGPQFARGCSDSETLSKVMHKLDELTLTKLLAAHDRGALEKIRRAQPGIRAIENSGR